MPPTVYDRHGNQQPWAWLEARFGPIVIHPKDPGPGWHCVALRENANLNQAERSSANVSAADAAAAVIRVHATGQAGDPAPGVLVAWYWPDAPGNPGAGPANGLPEGMKSGRADRPGTTNGAGDADFAMGGGAYYSPPNIGPHATWIYGADVNSDVVLGLGMLAGTDHHSLWVDMQWDPGDDPSPPETTGLRQALATLEAAIAAVREALS
jgi:hypothetical protein